MATQEVALRKRQQISKANRTMFLWVAGASALVGIGIVVAVLLTQRALFNEKILGDKATTLSTLEKNIKNVDQLKKQIQVMNTNQALIDSMVPGESQPIRVVLDALPSEANSSGFGSSLQQYFLNDPLLQVEAFNVDPVVGIESQDTSGDSTQTAAPVDGATTSDNSKIVFGFSVSTDAANISTLKTLLQKLERSIRAINVTSLAVEMQSNRIVLTVAGEAYYQPAATVQLKDQVEKP
jgi:hypothetical protein